MRIKTTYHEYVCDGCKKPFVKGDEVWQVFYSVVVTDGIVGQLLSYDPDLDDGYQYHLHCYNIGLGRIGK